MPGLGCLYVPGFWKGGVSINKIAKELGIAYSTAHKYVKALEA